MPSTRLFVAVAILVVVLLTAGLVGRRHPGGADAALVVLGTPAADRQSLEGHQHARRQLLHDDQRDLHRDRPAHSRDRRLRAASPRRRRSGLADVLDGRLVRLRRSPLVRRRSRPGRLRAGVPRQRIAAPRHQSGGRHRHVAVVDGRCGARLEARLPCRADGVLDAHAARRAAHLDLRLGAGVLDRAFEQRLCPCRGRGAAVLHDGLRALPHRRPPVRSDLGRRTHLHALLRGAEQVHAVVRPVDLGGGVQSGRPARGVAPAQPAQHLHRAGDQPGGIVGAAAVRSARPHAAQPRRLLQRPFQAVDGQLERPCAQRRQQHVLHQEQPGRALRPQHPDRPGVPRAGAGAHDAQPAPGQHGTAGAPPLHPGDLAQLPGRGLDPVRDA